MSPPNDYELGYDEGYQDGRVACEAADTVERLRAERDEWKARAEKAEVGLEFWKQSAVTWQVRAEKAEAEVLRLKKFILEGRSIAPVIHAKQGQ